MKTKIFKHNLLAAGTLAVLGLGVTTGAQALPEAYAVSSLEISNFTFDGDPRDFIEGQIESATDCKRNPGLPAPDDNDGEVAAIAIPPIPATHDAQAANCGSSRVNNAFNFIGSGEADYGTGDAYVANTNLFFGGAAQTFGEAHEFETALRTYTGEGRNTLATRFQLIANTTILTFAFDAKYMAYAEIKDNGPQTLANSNSSFSLRVTNVTDPDNPVVELEFKPGDLQPKATVAVSPNSDGSLVIDSTAFSVSTPALVAGTYTLELEMVSKATVKLDPPPIVFLGDHYLCYKSFGSFLRQEVNLVDQFDDVNFDVLKPKMFCNPAIKPIRDPEVGILNPEAHLLSYKINEAHREPRHVRQTVVMHDQFFSALTLQTVNPDRLMVPSGKSLDGSIPNDPAGSINHFKCYRVRTLNGFQEIPVNIADQFTDDINNLIDPLDADVEIEGKDLVLIRPTRMCTPVDKNGEGIVENPDADQADPRDHLMCYRVKTEKGARLNRRIEVTSNNQFRNEDLVLKRELEFCAPATKTVITGRGTGG